MLIVPFCVRITFEGTYGGRPWANILDCVYDDSSPPARDAALPGIALVAEANWASGPASVCSDNVLLTNVRVQDLDSAVGQITELPSTENGALTGSGMPPNVSALITKISPHSRSQRNGRWFQVGVLESQTDTGAPELLNSSAVTLYTSEFAGFLSDMTTTVDGSALYPVTLHRSSAPSGYTPAVITQLVPQAMLATQRRRLRG